VLDEEACAAGLASPRGAQADRHGFGKLLKIQGIEGAQQ